MFDSWLNQMLIIDWIIRGLFSHCSPRPPCFTWDVSFSDVKSHNISDNICPSGQIKTETAVKALIVNWT